jgi:NADP-dependent aldehyde dehydrogenase
MSTLQTYDPRSGTRRDAGIAETTAAEVAALCARAADAAVELADLDTWTLARRADALRSIADHLDEHRDELVGLADEETALGAGRLDGEVVRTTGQLRLFADAVEEGSFLEVIVDRADPDHRPLPLPELRRMLQPIGPVGVFAASNFPFAFSVAGGDTASALAAGCSVVVKAHQGHPRTSARTAELVADALAHASMRAGTFGIVYGRDAGRLLVSDPHVKAVGFTGSQGGGRALFDLAVSRPDPIPFFGELGSLNPVVVTPAAIAARAADIATGFVGSFTLGGGQFCTKPGLLFAPRGHGLEAPLADALADVPAAALLTPAIREGFGQRAEQIGGSEAVRLLAGSDANGDLAVPPRVYAASSAALVAHPDVADECFGPAAIVVEWDAEDDLLAALDVVAGSLTATVHAEPDDPAVTGRLMARLRRLAGRIVWNGWPTGVAVTWSMHHGGPFPVTTNPLHTSVGVTALRRFLVPIVYQNAPDERLPTILRDGNPLGVPRRESR